MLSESCPTKFSPIDVEKVSGPMPSGLYLLRYRHCGLRVRYKCGERAIGIICFHGAINRKIREVPFLQRPFSGVDGCHQLIIADPTLEIDPDTSLGWYLGTESFNLQDLLPELLAIFWRRLGVVRRLYIGGSGGGFAALFYSHRDIGSVCLAVNPQVNLGVYSIKTLENIRVLGWQSIASTKDLGSILTLDVASIYKNSFENFVVYLQSAGDIHHSKLHFSSFFQAVLHNFENVILVSDYYGIPGHSGSIPPKIVQMWICALVDSSWGSRDEILKNLPEVSERFLALRGRPAPAPMSGSRNALAGDDEKRRLIRDWQLGRV